MLGQGPVVAIIRKGYFCQVELLVWTTLFRDLITAMIKSIVDPRFISAAWPKKAVIL